MQVIALLLRILAILAMLGYSYNVHSDVIVSKKERAEKPKKPKKKMESPKSGNETDSNEDDNREVLAYAKKANIK